MAIVGKAVSRRFQGRQPTDSREELVTSTPRPMQLILIVFHNYICNIGLHTLLDEVVRYRGGRRLDKPWSGVD